MIEIIFALTLCASCFGFEADLTVDIGAGKMECFFQPISKPNGVELEYQVGNFAMPGALLTLYFQFENRETLYDKFV